MDTIEDTGVLHPDSFYQLNLYSYAPDSIYFAHYDLHLQPSLENYLYWLLVLFCLDLPKAKSARGLHSLVATSVMSE